MIWNRLNKITLRRYNLTSIIHQTRTFILNCKIQSIYLKTKPARKSSKLLTKIYRKLTRIKVFKLQLRITGKKWLNLMLFAIKPIKMCSFKKTQTRSFRMTSLVSCHQCCTGCLRVGGWSSKFWNSKDSSWTLELTQFLKCQGRDQESGRKWRKTIVFGSIELGSFMKTISNGWSRNL